MTAKLSQSKDKKSGSVDHLFKLLTIGNSGVGKTCILMRFVDKEFNSTFISTIGIDFKIKHMKINGQNIKLQIWDTAGQERFKTITTAYYRGANGIILVFDVTCPESFNSVKEWMKSISTYASKYVKVVLVANKCDNIENRRVSEKEGKEMAQEYDIPYFETSAKTGENIDESINHIVHRICEFENNNKKSNQETIKLNDNTKYPKKCCE